MFKYQIIYTFFYKTNLSLQYKLHINAFYEQVNDQRKTAIYSDYICTILTSQSNHIHNIKKTSKRK